jgi:hypothetical protein
MSTSRPRRITRRSDSKWSARKSGETPSACAASAGRSAIRVTLDADAVLNSNRAAGPSVALTMKSFLTPLAIWRSKMNFFPFGAHGRRDRTLPPVEHWDGTRWQIGPGIVTPFGLFDLDARGASDVCAVGPASGLGALVDHWNGSDRRSARRIRRSLGRGRAHQGGVWAAGTAGLTAIVPRGRAAKPQGQEALQLLLLCEAPSSRSSRRRGLPRASWLLPGRASDGRC